MGGLNGHYAIVAGLVRQLDSCQPLVWHDHDFKRPHRCDRQRSPVSKCTAGGEGLANLVSRLTLLLQNRGLDSSRSLFMTVMQAEVEAKPQAKAELLERAIHNAEATQQLKRIGERSILLRRPRPN